MKAKNCSNRIVAVLVISLFSVMGLAAFMPSGNAGQSAGQTPERFGVTLTIDRPVYTVNLMPTVKPGGRPAPLLRATLEVFYFTDSPDPYRLKIGGCTFEFIVRDAKGNEVLRSLGPCVAAVGFIDLHNNSASFEANILLVRKGVSLLPEGAYTIEGRLPGNNISATTAFAIDYAR